MTRRGSKTTAPAKPEAAPVRRATALDSETADAAHDSPLLRVAHGQGGAPPARAQATALRQATGGRLARAGHVLLQLQGQYGNRYVQRVVGHAREATNLAAAPVVQAKLVLGPAGDRYEREADRVAARAAGRAAGHGPVALGRTGEGGDARSPRQPDVQRLRGAAGVAVDAPVAQAVQRAHGGGRPLPARLRESMERALGADFGAVRVHTGAQSDRLNRSLQAAAFTSGRDIFFRRGAYEPGSRRGQELLAHELTHVVQQRQGAAIQRKIVGMHVTQAEEERASAFGGISNYGFNNRIVITVDGDTDINNVRLHRRVRMFRYQTSRKTGRPEGKQTPGTIQNIYSPDHVRVVDKNTDHLTVDGWDNPRWQDDGPEEHPPRVTRSGRTITVSDRPGFPIHNISGNLMWRNPSEYKAEFEFTAEELTDADPSGRAGGIAGAVAGGIGLGAIGSLLGPAGTVIGGALGAIGGYLGGRYATRATPKYGTKYVASSMRRAFTNHYRDPAIFN